MATVSIETPEGLATIQTYDDARPAEVTAPKGWTRSLEYDAAMWWLMDEGYAPDASSKLTLSDGRIRQYHPGGYRIPRTVDGSSIGVEEFGGVLV